MDSPTRAALNSMAMTETKGVPRLDTASVDSTRVEITWATPLVISAVVSPLDAHDDLQAEDLWSTDAELKAAVREKADASKGATDPGPPQPKPCTADAVQAATATGTLNLLGLRLKDEEIVSLLEQCEATDATPLVNLDLRGNRLGDAGARALASRLAAKGCRIEKLALWDNCVGTLGAVAVCEALDFNTSLSVLDLGKQQHADAGNCGDALACRLAVALQHNTTLTSVDLRYAGITDAGASTLADALPRSTAPLARLDLRYNAVGAAGLRALAVGLADAACVPHLHVHVQPNAYGDRDAAMLADELEADPRLAPLNQGPERLWF